MKKSFSTLSALATRALVGYGSIPTPPQTLTGAAAVSNQLEEFVVIARRIEEKQHAEPVAVSAIVSAAIGK